MLGPASVRLLAMLSPGSGQALIYFSRNSELKVPLAANDGESSDVQMKNH
jgi:hypothetical protein